MGGLVEGNETYIRKFRVVSNERDALALRLRVGRALESADLQPAGLPRSAVVCIRHLRVPGGVRFDLTDTRLAAAWQAAVAKSIEQMVTRAASPALAPVPSDAPAVVFLDRAELLACIASDWCDGLLPTRWWWQGLLRNDFAANVVKDTWKAAPEYVPAALASLANKKKAVEFVQSWSHAESLGLLQDVIKSFALHELVPVIAFVQDTNGSVERHTRNSSPPSWQRWVPESDAAGLEVGPQLLLSISLLLRRVPAVVRTADFAREITDWCRPAASPVANLEDNRTTRDARPDLKSSVNARPDDRVDSSVDDIRASGIDVDKAPKLSVERSTTAHSTAETTKFSNSVKAEHQPSLSATEDYLPEKSAATKPTEIVSSSPRLPITESSNTTLFDHQPDRVTFDHSGNQEIDSQAVPNTVLNDAFINREHIETQFGGLFYLINLGLYLNLYGDFTTPAKPGIELNIWDFVALIGEELIGSNDDPIWPFLAQLAGREPDQTPGELFAPDDSWRIAPEWLTHFSSSGSWQWSARDGRLRLLHPAGFSVLDIPLECGDPADQLREEIKESESVLQSSLNLEMSSEPELNGYSEPVNTNAAPEIRTWLSRLMPYVRARLRAALDVQTKDDLAPLLCRRFARVDATDTHVEVFFSLADLPLEIRLAGLDRDPGWVPAAGRFIAFHFD